MKLNNYIKFFISLFLIIILCGCNSKIKVKNIAPSIDEFQEFTITCFMGNEVDYKLDDDQIESIKEDMPYFYECKYFTADTTRTPFVELTVKTNDTKLEFICALDSNEERCYMLNINAVSYNIKDSKEFRKEHNFFSSLYTIASNNYFK